LNILCHIVFTLSIIEVGLAYCFTSIPNSPPKIGKTNIETTVTIIHITAYLIVLIAGFILSSLPPDNIKSKPHHKINRIDNIPAINTNSEIIVNIKSPGSILGQKIGVVLLVSIAAFAISNIFF
jgi:hypothetical protein